MMEVPSALSLGLSDLYQTMYTTENNRARAVTTTKGIHPCATTLWGRLLTIMSTVVGVVNLSMASLILKFLYSPNWCDSHCISCRSESSNI